MKAKDYVLYFQMPYRYKKTTTWMHVLQRLEKQIRYSDQESVWVMTLDAVWKVISLDMIALGGINESFFDPRIIFKRILMVGGTGFALIHNHPGGKAEPTKSDRKLWKDLESSAKTLQLKFHDHFVIGVDGIRSARPGKKKWKKARDR